MKHEYLERFKAWSNEEIEILKAKGAREHDLKEPEFNSLVVESVLEEHRDQILTRKIHHGSKKVAKSFN
jgi:hypothetical protein